MLPEPADPSGRKRTLCSAYVERCPACGHTVGRGRLRRGEGCPRDPGVVPAPSTCRRPVAVGQTRCTTHGSGNPRSRVARRRAQAEAAVRRLAARDLMREQVVNAALAGVQAELRHAERVARLGDPAEGARLMRKAVAPMRTAAERVQRRARQLEAEAGVVRSHKGRRVTP